jgi:2-furoyl-CoA dehydrogenase FAD binding subunit
MKAAPFKYARPVTLDEALHIVAEGGDDVKPIAGGQSLGAMLNMRIVTPSVVLDLNAIAELSSLDGRRTGAMVRQKTALVDADFRRAIPLLSQAVPYVGHYQTRNRGTLGGSVAHADPSAEIPLTLATLGGTVELQTKRRTRKLSADEFFRSALVTARAPDELLTALHWPALPPSTRSSFHEFAVREGDFAIVAVACIVDPKRGLLRLGFGGCGEKPQVVEQTGIDVSVSSVVDDAIAHAVGSLEYRGDLLATAAYRRQLASVLSRRAVNTAITERIDG